MSFAICAMVSSSWLEAGNVNLARKFSDAAGLSIGAAVVFAAGAIIFSV